MYTFFFCIFKDIAIPDNTFQGKPFKLMNIDNNPIVMSLNKLSHIDGMNNFITVNKITKDESYACELDI